MESIPSLNYITLQKLLQSITYNPDPNVLISKEEFRQLLGTCQCRREREILTYTLHKASGISISGMKRHYGIHDMSQRSLEVQKTLQDVQTIRESIEDSLMYSYKLL